MPATLELGGKGAAVISDDVASAQTAEQLAGAITFHTGQVCCDATRWIINEKVYDKFLSSCVDKMANVKVGHECDAESQMGPVVSDKQRNRVLGYLDKGVAAAIETRTGTLGPDGAAEGELDLALANISGLAIYRLAPALADALKPGGHLVASGFLDDAADGLGRAFEAAGLRVERVIEDGVWRAVLARREA